MMKLFTLIGSLVLLLFNGLLTRATAKGSNYVSAERLYTDKDGKVVREDSPARAFLLVAKGGEISYDEALKHGLIDVEGNAVPLAELTAEEASFEVNDAPEPVKKPATKRHPGPSEDK